METHTSSPIELDLAPGVPGGEDIAYSQVALTGGVDAVGTYPSILEPLTSLITLERNDTILAIEIVRGIEGAQPIPEPSSALLFGAGFLVVGTAIRRSKKR